MIFQDTLNPSEVLTIIKKERVSVVVAVPRLMESLKDKIERDMEADGQTRKGFSSSSPPPKISTS